MYGIRRRPSVPIMHPLLAATVTSSIATERQILAARSRRFAHRRRLFARRERRAAWGPRWTARLE
jgi:hypothetical protein